MTADITNEANANTINAAADVVATVKNKEINKSSHSGRKTFEMNREILSKACFWNEKLEKSLGL